MKKKEAKRMNFKANGLLFYCILFAIPVIQFCVFYLGVNFNSILLAFKDYDVFTGKYSYTGFDNFKRFFNDLGYGNILSYAWKNSLKIYLFGYLSTTLSICFSFYIFKKKAAYNTLRIILFLPSVLSTIVMAILFRYISGLVLPEIGLQDFLSIPQSQFDMLIFYGIWIGFGSSVLLYSGAMGQVSTEVLEAAEVDGAGPFIQFVKILLPSIYPTISTFLITGVAGIFLNQAGLFDFYAEAAQPISYTLGYYLFMHSEQLITSTDAYPSFSTLSAMGVLMTLVMVPITLLLRKGLNKVGPSEE